MACGNAPAGIAGSAFFNAVRVDPGGYGISWSDDIDLSEYELWTNGKTVPNKSLEADMAKSRHAVYLGDRGAGSFCAYNLK